ncbi:MAG: hypothetical protein J6T25_03070 [Bacilli bacterium]|nr:hypothetical protein [Bacilli bacterium]
MKRKTITMVAILAGMLLSSCGGTTKPQEDYTEAFKRARDNTQELIEYQYDFELTASIKYKDAVSFSPATYRGTTYVNTSNSETQFLQKRELSGLLVFDSTTYIYNSGTDLIKISADEDKDFSVINHETVPSVYDFDKHNFGYILKNLNDSGFSKAKYSSGKYELSLHTNFSQDSILNVLNFIDSKLILKAINKFTTKEWGVGLSVNSWATIDDNSKCLKVFHFDAGISIKDTFDIRFNFEQTFTKYSGVTITLPSFANTINDETAIKNELNTIKTIYNDSKAAATSYYTYKVKTTVDHGVSKSNPLGLAVNSTTQGNARRQILNDKVYFNNKIEVDSDYKNNDQLGNLIKDYNSYRAMLNDGNDTVYDVDDPTIGTNKYYALSNYDNYAIDEYYMLPVSDFLSFDNIKIIKKTTDKNNNTIYKFGLTTDSIKQLLNHYNKSIRIDFTGATVFDIYNIQSDFSGKKASFKLTVNSDGKIASLDIDLKGFYVEKESSDHVKYRLETSIQYDWGKTYNAATKKEDIDNK